MKHISVLSLSFYHLLLKDDNFDHNYIQVTSIITRAHMIKQIDALKNSYEHVSKQMRDIQRDVQMFVILQKLAL